MKNSKTIKAFKGFNKDLTCRNFQYKEGETYTHEGKAVKCTNQGFHSCTYPLDVFNYYPPASSVFHVVEAAGDIDSEEEGDSKISSSQITVKEGLSLNDLISSAVSYIIDNAEEGVTSSSDEESSSATNTGDSSAATNTGWRSAATNTGDSSSATNTGDFSAATNTGRYSAASVEGEHSVAMASGYGSKAKASLGSAIVVCLRDTDGKLLDIKSAIVDGTSLKQDTYYKLNSEGEFVESE